MNWFLCFLLMDDRILGSGARTHFVDDSEYLDELEMKMMSTNESFWTNEGNEVPGDQT